MKTPDIVLDWLREKCEHGHWSSVREHRTVSREWVRHTGGRIMRAALTGAIAPAKDFEIHVNGGDSEPEYIAAAKNGALTVLLSQSSAPVLAVKLTLSNFIAHGSESSYAAFYAAAHEVTSHLLGVAPGTQHNIEW
jgi:hypothetical protein